MSQVKYIHVGFIHFFLHFFQHVCRTITLSVVLDDFDLWTKDAFQKLINCLTVRFFELQYN